jgi:hypothetical protein
MATYVPGRGASVGGGVFTVRQVDWLLLGLTRLPLLRLSNMVYDRQRNAAKRTHNCGNT